MADYLNLPTEETQLMIAQALNKLAEQPLPVDDVLDGPGSNYLYKGTKKNGIYSIVDPKEFGNIAGNPDGRQNLSASNLALAIGLTQGSAQNEDTHWVKLSSDDRVTYVPVGPLRSHVSWNAIYNAGAVYGDDTIGVNPPNGRAGDSISADSTNRAFVIDNANDPWLRAGGVTASAGDTIVVRGFENSQNNGEFTVESITDQRIVVNSSLINEDGNNNVSVYKKGDEVTQNTVITIGDHRYRVRLLKSAVDDPSVYSGDRETTGSEFNRIILPLMVYGKTNSWNYSAYAKDVEYWGIDLTNKEMVFHHEYGLGSRSWMQETADDYPARRLIRGYYGVSYSVANSSWYVNSDGSWRPALDLLSKAEAQAEA